MNLGTEGAIGSARNLAKQISKNGLGSKLEKRGFRERRKSWQSSDSPGTMEAGVQWLRSYYTSFCRVTSVLLLLLIEDAIQDNLFVCPCKSMKLNRLYSLAFLLMPALILFVAAIMLNSVTWRAVTGCRARRRHGRYGCRNWARVLGRLFPGAFVAPYVWIVFSFLDGRFFECMQKDGDSCSHLPGDELALETELYMLQTSSQLWGYLLLLLGLVAWILYTCVSRIRSPLTYEHQNYLAIFEKEFAIQKDLLITEFTRDTLRRDIRHFIENVLIDDGSDSEVSDTGSNPGGQRSRGSTLEDIPKIVTILDQEHDRAIRAFNGINEEDEAKEKLLTWFQNEEGVKEAPVKSEEKTCDGDVGASLQMSGSVKKKRAPFRPYWRENSHDKWESLTRPVFVEKPGVSAEPKERSSPDDGDVIEMKHKKKWKRAGYDPRESEPIARESTA